MLSKILHHVVSAMRSLQSETSRQMGQAQCTSSTSCSLTLPENKSMLPEHWGEFAAVHVQSRVEPTTSPQNNGTLHSDQAHSYISNKRAMACVPLEHSFLDQAHDTNQTSWQWPVVHCKAGYRFTRSYDRQTIGRMCLQDHLLIVGMVAVCGNGEGKCHLLLQLQLWNARAPAGSFQGPSKIKTPEPARPLLQRISWLLFCRPSILELQGGGSRSRLHAACCSQARCQILACQGKNALQIPKHLHRRPVTFD